MASKHVAGQLDDPTDSIVEEAQGVILRISDTTDAQPRPSHIDTFYVEDEYDHRAGQQHHLFRAEGEKLAASASATVAALTDRVEAVSFIRQARTERYQFLLQQWRLAEQALRPYVRRSKAGKVTYYGFMAAFLLGDVAGISGAQVLRGEIVALAIIQSAAAAAATVMAGVVGRDLRDLERQRYRRRDGDLPAELHPYGHLFQGQPSGSQTTRLVLWLGGAVALLVGIAILALRASVDGTLGGVIYGALAVAIAGGSALNAWSYADDVADQLDSHADALKKAEEELNRVSSNQDVQSHHAAEAKARSVRAEYADRGAAAVKHMHALKQMIMRENPQIAGHGRPASQQPLISDEQLAAWARDGVDNAS